MLAQPLTQEQTDDADRLKSIYERKKKELGLTQELIAANCQWESQGTVSQYLNAKIPLNLEAAVKFALQLKCQVSEFSPSLAVKQRELSGVDLNAERATASPYESAQSLRRTVAAIAREWGVDPADLADPSDEALERLQRAIEQAQEKKHGGREHLQDYDSSRPAVFRRGKSSRGKDEPQP